MKTRAKNRLLMPALIVGIGLMLAGHVIAASLTTLHTFAPSYGNFSGWSTIYYNSDGLGPGQLILSGNRLYGVCGGGTSSGFGTVFAVNTDGTGFTNLHNFTTNLVPLTFFITPNNSDGAFPSGPLVLSGTTLYGTASRGGTNSTGTLFSVNIDGTGFANLHTFDARVNLTNSDGAFPESGLVISGTKLFGACLYGGASGVGTVFSINTDGTGFTNLHNFTGTNDGSSPSSGLVLSSNILYGLTSLGGSSSDGTAFAINTDGTGYTNLHNFIGGNDGSDPSGGLVLAGNKLYGGTSGGPGATYIAGYGGSVGAGTVFAVNTDGTGFTNICIFNGTDDGYGGSPSVWAVSGSTLYGSEPGQEGEGGIINGYLFDVSTQGPPSTLGPEQSGFLDLSDMGGPALLFTNNTFYFGDGSVYSLSLGPLPKPQLTIAPAGSNVVISWPTNAFDTSGFTLQCATTFGSTNWSTVSLPPVVLNGQYTVTNAISGTQMFYRLMQ